MDLDQTPWRVVFHYVDDFRIMFNRKLDHLEPWQIILYTLSAVLFFSWIRKVLKFEEYTSFRKWRMDFLRNFPMYATKWQQGIEAAGKELEERLLRHDRLKEFYKFLPDRGLHEDDILHEATTYRTMSDILFEKGRFCGSMYGVEDEDPNHQRLLKGIFDLYGFTNASYPDVFPGCRKMEAEVIRMLCSLYHGGGRSCGAVTTSGTESIILACLAYRNRAMKRGVRKPEIIIGNNAHVAFSKAAKLLGMRAIRIRSNNKWEVNVGAIKRAISRETCMIAASAPGFVYGVMDSIEEISRLGQKYRVPVHVDATIGGLILPFMEQCDYPAPMFDFRLSGVSSISVDLSKDLMYYQCYSNIGWSAGIYVSPTLNGTRSGLLVALTWATLLHNGRLGYVEKTQRILDASRQLRAKMAEVTHLELMGDPLGPVIVFTTSNPAKIHPHMLGDEMNELGWTFGFLQNPNALRLCVSLHHAKHNVVNDFIEDINKCCEKIINNTEYVYPAKTNPIYGLSTAFPDRGVADHMPVAFVDAYYATPTQPHRGGRTLSIEGRKLSQINMPTSLLATLQEKYSSEPAVTPKLTPPRE
ncbi:pyridoxal-dependent decarboxylase conserved domain-containing protein [Ditylenchus destructor]|uniref:sphinganine-1-phosphate aldolase n=1 Tax=Ditylenchus destructor TaxID=166010 RepID=A0AAD4N0P3_9BILA|nr:pyridoxal-dependent decarboxylase conserved domain-containing protein [Ditylenchus destructor]